MSDRYNNGSYLKQNTDWHQEDSPYKASLVIKMLEQSRLHFTNCADVGCGAGLVASLLAKRFHNKQFIGFDTSQDAARFWAKNEANNLTFSLQDIVAVKQRFDVILCLDVFEHVEDYIGFLKELRERGSKFIFNIPLDMSVAKLLTGGLRYVREEVGHLHYFSTYSAIETLRYAGYTIEHSFLSAMFRKTMPRNVRQAFMLAPRLLASVLGDHLAALLTGGYSLVVLASAAEKSASNGA
jgi:SAM-dependent methyltransferase